MGQGEGRAIDRLCDALGRFVARTRRATSRSGRRGFVNRLAIGVDLGGTKIEAIALDEGGVERWRRRAPTPQGDYPATLAAICSLVEECERELGMPGEEGERKAWRRCDACSWGGVAGMRGLCGRSTSSSGSLGLPMRASRRAVT